MVSVDGLLGTGRGEGVREVVEEGDYYTYRYTVTTRMTPAFLAVVSHFNVSLIVRDKLTRPLYLKRKESRSGFEPRSLCLPA